MWDVKSEEEEEKKGGEEGFTLTMWDVKLFADTVPAIFVSVLP